MDLWFWGRIFIPGTLPIFHESSLRTQGFSHESEEISGNPKGQVSTINKWCSGVKCLLLTLAIFQENPILTPISSLRTKKYLRRHPGDS
jgi:hypothetical protein